MIIPGSNVGGFLFLGTALCFAAIIQGQCKFHVVKYGPCKNKMHKSEAIQAVIWNGDSKLPSASVM